MPAQPGTARSGRPGRRAAALGATGLLAAVVALALLVAPDARIPSSPSDDAVALAASGTNPPTPGNFNGYGFDQCDAPTQAKMNTWMQESPFTAAGIYISGASRACKTQKNLTATWVTNQLAQGWRLLPITLGPQASCSTRYPKYGKKIDPTIDPNPAGGYSAAAAQGRVEAARAIIAAGNLGIVKGSVLFYDLEAFDLNNYHCKQSAIRFVHGWSGWLKSQGYKSGFYSSAGSGIKMLDWLRKNNSAGYILPDVLWIARWDGQANVSVSSSYLDPGAWMPNARVKQYQGGHNETWGGVTINIDRNYLKVGPFTNPVPNHCGGVEVNLPVYNMLRTPTATYSPDPKQVKALQCLLSEWKVYTGPINGAYDAGTRTAAMNWQALSGFPKSTNFTVRDWSTLFTRGATPALKLGSTGLYVRRAQRALRVLRPSLNVQVNGIYGGEMWNAITTYRKSVGLPAGGVLNTRTWQAMQAGKY